MDALPYRPCVGIVLCNRDGLVFAAKRLDSDTEAWQMPQGGIDKGEDARDAALRELGEETSVQPKDAVIVNETTDWLYYDLPPALIPRLWNGQYRGQKQLWYLMRFTGADSDINIQTEIPEFSCWQWMDVGGLMEKIVPFKRDVYSQVFKTFGLWGV